jgi:hypothetical protein
MKCISKHAIAAVILVLSIAAPVAAQQGDFTTTVYGALDKALRGGDWAPVVRLARPFADQGNAEAQNMLGTIYRDGGLGVPQAMKLR